MILIISSQGRTLDSKPNPRFGRAPIFIRYNLESDAWVALNNPAVTEQGGAGVAASQFIIDQGVSDAISGNFGPNAYQALKTAGVLMWSFNQDYGTVQAVIDAYVHSELKQINHPG
jgi:predicted Fe-Mo cluster-binding NifX family protein